MSAAQGHSHAGGMGQGGQHTCKCTAAVCTWSTRGWRVLSAAGLMGPSQVCEKVRQKKRTTYVEVADELVQQANDPHHMDFLDGTDEVPTLRSPRHLRMLGNTRLCTEAITWWFECLLTTSA
jgi:hypothetical protein